MRARVAGLFVYPIQGFRGVASYQARWDAECGFLSQYQFKLRTEAGVLVSPQNCPNLSNLNVKFLLSKGLIEVGTNSDSKKVFDLVAGNVALEKTLSAKVGQRVRLLPVEQAAGDGPSIVSLGSLRAIECACGGPVRARALALSQPDILVEIEGSEPFYEDRWCADRSTLGVGGLLLAVQFSKRIGSRGLPYLAGSSYDSHLLESLERLRQESENPPLGEVQKGSNFLGITTRVLNAEDCPLVAYGDTISLVRRSFRAFRPVAAAMAEAS